jgi:hypothetical protein
MESETAETLLKTSQTLGFLEKIAVGFATCSNAIFSGS